MTPIVETFIQELTKAGSAFSGYQKPTKAQVELFARALIESKVNQKIAIMVIRAIPVKCDGFPTLKKLLKTISMVEHDISLRSKQKTLKTENKGQVNRAACNKCFDIGAVVLKEGIYETHYKCDCPAGVRFSGLPITPA